MRLAVIPARGGSKRIPRKNIKPFCGQPMIAYAIQTALETELFDQVVVSTDDEPIAAVAQRYGASVPVMRPKALADDHAQTLPVIKHAITASEAVYQTRFDWVCCIYPTTPLLTSATLQQGYDLLTSKPQLDYVFAAVPFEYPVYRGFTLDDQGQAQMLWPEYFKARSQDLPLVYHDAGQFYWGRRQAFVSEAVLLGEQAQPLVLSSNEAQDIDDLADWERAEQLYQRTRANEYSHTS